ncbi:MAG: LacI family DNA-binding transcriptional regulator [Hyphomicrobiales bacterium]|nr:LacI family DNA-binding transcriptional regulator [Hyphomicrobiales bacterium]
MSRRPTIADLARAAGVSVATVDRVLNARHRVRGPTAERVIGAAEAIGYHAAALLRTRLHTDLPERTFAFLLQRPDAFYAQFGADLAAATRALSRVRGKPVVDFAPDLSPAVVAERLLRLGESAQAIAIVSVDHPRISDAIAALRARGVPTFAILTELGAEAAAPYIGRDNRKEGRTAAWLIAKAAKRPGKVGIIVGSHRFLCQEIAEISFRAYLRENAPEFTPLEPVVNLEDPRIAYAATQDMIATHRDLVGLYICGGGTEGVIAGARDDLDARGLAIVCNELTPKSRAGLIDGVLTAVISTPTALLAERALAAMAGAIAAPQETVHNPVFVPFELYLPTNV